MSFGVVQAEKMTTESGYSLGAGNASSFKNRIINGGMTIDQRNAGASFTPTTSNVFSLDRWAGYCSTSSKFSIQQVTDAPAGFNSSAKITSLSAYTLSVGDYFAFSQQIEGYNVADIGFATANAKPLMLSFWVKSSLTGSFGGSIQDATEIVCYGFVYTINSANTWEYKTVPISAYTGGSGTWSKTNSSGCFVWFGLGAGSTRTQSTTDTWLTSQSLQPTGTTQVVATNGATWQITGVQLEVGTVATSFDFRSYGTELALCQRYFQKYAGQPSAYLGNGNSARNGYLPSFIYPVKMRSAPTASNITGFAAGNATTYAFSSPSIVTTADGLYEIYGISSVAINYSEPFCAFFTTLDLSSEL